MIKLHVLYLILQSRCPKANICGPNLVSVGVGCYRYFEEKNKVMSWNEASDRCTEFGGYLATLATAQKRTIVENMLRKLPDTSIPIGLQLASAKLPEM